MNSPLDDPQFREAAGQQAAPLCRQYGARHGLACQGLSYPIVGKSSSTTSSSGSCRFVDATGRETRVSLTRLEPSWVTGFAVSWALQLELNAAIFCVLIALLALAHRGAGTA